MNHKISVVVNAREVLDFTEYAIETSLVQPADTFNLTRAFDRDAWEACRRDARVKVLIDGQPRIDGFIDARTKGGKSGAMTIMGRDRAGRMVDESAPRSVFGGTTLLGVIEALAKPWFDRVSLSGARNRKVTTGRGSKVAGADEALSLRRGGRAKAKARDPIQALFAKPTKSSRIDAGRSRWDVLEETISRAGLCAWSSADGKELIVGKPDQTQPATFTFRHAAAGRQGNVDELDYEESNDQRYSMIACVGSGLKSPADFGAAGSRSGVVYDHDAGPRRGSSPFDSFTGPAQRDGTGRDFQYRKWLVLADESARDNDEAKRLAQREQARRDFRRTHITITAEGHGQDLGAGVPTLFAIETMARVIDEEIDLDDDFLIYAASFRGDRESGATTTLEMVPRGTEVVL
jgi:prophage tail gpP-like protein